MNGLSILVIANSIVIVTLVTLLATIDYLGSEQELFSNDGVDGSPCPSLTGAAIHSWAPST